jgi:hypothetical protein
VPIQSSGFFDIGNQCFAQNIILEGWLRRPRVESFSTGWCDGCNDFHAQPFAGVDGAKATRADAEELLGCPRERQAWVWNAIPLGCIVGGFS